MCSAVFLLFASAITCIAVEVPLVWKESRQIEMTRSGRYAEYMERLNRLRTTQAPDLMDITMYEFNSEYGQNITLGRPEQPFFVWVTLSTSMLWVPHPDCESMACKGKRKYISAESSTFVRIKDRWETIGYGGIARGEYLGSDEMRLGGEKKNQLIVRRTSFGLAMQVDSLVGEVQFDGSLGLAFSPQKGTKGDPFITNAVDKGAFDEPVFTVWLKSRMVADGEPGGAITYGAIDTYNCGKVFKYENLTSDVSYQFQVDSVSLGEFKQEQKLKVELHLNTFIKGPSAAVAKIAKIAGAKPMDDGIFYSIDCNANFPDLKITAGSTAYWIHHEKLIKKVKEGSCIFLLSSLEQGPTFEAAWYFGVPLLRQYCVVFNVEKKRVGFATPIPQEEKSSTTKRPAATFITKRIVERTTVKGGPGLLSCSYFSIFSLLLSFSLHCGLA